MRLTHLHLAHRSIPLVMALFAPAASAELLIGLTTQNNLISFDSATPGTVSVIGPVSGVAAGDIIVGIDRRPQFGLNNGRLYGFGLNPSADTARIYTIDESTAAATLISTLAADPGDTTGPFPLTTVTGNIFGVDFNPIVDRLRVVSQDGQNLRINVDNGLTQLDVPLAYQSGDPNFGRSLWVTGVAYSNNFAGATSTTLRGVNELFDPDTLVVHTDPNGGVLQTSLALPSRGRVASYDISGLTGTGYITVNIQEGPGGPSTLYAAGASGVTLVGTVGGGVYLHGLAAPVGEPVVPEPASLAITAMATGLLLKRRRRA